MRRLVKVFAVGFVLSTACVYAQDGGPPGGPHGMRGMGGGPFGHMGPGRPGFGPFGKVVTGAPYSADVSNQSVQTLSDGNTVQHSTTGHISRDSVGRTYSQETITGGPFGQAGPVVVTFINDPVTGYAYVLNAKTKVATRRAIPKPPSGTPPAGAWNGPRGPRDSADVVTSDLGTQTIAGITAQGKIVTHTVPAGAIGNAQPIVSTSETWYSPDLQVIVLAKRNDLRTGQSTYSLTNIERSEPAAALFQVPSDYTVQDADAGAAWQGRFRGPGGPPRQ